MSGHPFAGSELVSQCRSFSLRGTQALCTHEKSQSLSRSPSAHLLSPGTWHLLFRPYCRQVSAVPVNRTMVARAVYRNFLGSLWLSISCSFRACPELSPLVAASCFPTTTTPLRTRIHDSSICSRDRSNTSSIQLRIFSLSPTYIIILAINRL